jgi:hypothetical protein
MFLWPEPHSRSNNSNYFFQAGSTGWARLFSPPSGGWNIGSFNWKLPKVFNPENHACPVKFRRSI